jgi:hypothetical protein
MDLDVCEAGERNCERRERLIEAAVAEPERVGTDAQRRLRNQQEICELDRLQLRALHHTAPRSIMVF